MPTSALVEAAVATILANPPPSYSPSPSFSPSYSHASGTGDDDDSQGECQLLGPFALLVQLALGGLALLSLVYKRWRERPQRPLKIWFFDVSKQVFGSVLVHVANVFMSMLTSGRFDVKLDPTASAAAATATVSRMLMLRDVGSSDDDVYVPNPCSFYLLNLAIDTTIGIPILIVLLRVVTALVAWTPFGKPAESIQSGHYGSPPRALWWLKQSIIYFIGLFGMKICVLVIFLMAPLISRVGDWALGWTDGNEKLQIAFVMMIFPLIMNAMQYYIIDSFIKEKSPSERPDGHHHERLLSEDPDDGSDEGDDGRGRGREDTPSDTEADEAAIGSQKRKVAEYNPQTDGQAPDVADGSSSTRVNNTNTNSKAVPPSLYPKE